MQKLESWPINSLADCLDMMTAAVTRSSGPSVIDQSQARIVVDGNRDLIRDIVANQRFGRFVDFSIDGKWMILTINKDKSI